MFKASLWCFVQWLLTIQTIGNNAAMYLSIMSSLCKTIFILLFANNTTLYNIYYAFAFVDHKGVWNGAQVFPLPTLHSVTYIYPLYKSKFNIVTVAQFFLVVICREEEGEGRTDVLLYESIRAEPQFSRPSSNNINNTCLKQPVETVASREFTPQQVIVNCYIPYII